MWAKRTISVGGASSPSAAWARSAIRSEFCASIHRFFGQATPAVSTLKHKPQTTWAFAVPLLRLSLPLLLPKLIAAEAALGFGDQALCSFSFLF
jgi:hypothetical protein